MTILRRALLPVAALALGALVLLLVPSGLEAQAQPTGPRMRDFWHVFIAYALAWAILFGWVVATFRRLGRVKERLDAE